MRDETPEGRRCNFFCPYPKPSARRKLWELFHRQICSAVHFVKGTHVCGKLASKLWLVKFDGRYSNAISLIIACLSQRRLYSIGSVLIQILSYRTETVLSKNITRNRIVLSFKDSSRKPLVRRPRERSRLLARSIAHANLGGRASKYTTLHSLQKVIRQKNLISLHLECNRSEDDQNVVRKPSQSAWIQLLESYMLSRGIIISNVPHYTT